MQAFDLQMEEWQRLGTETAYQDIWQKLAIDHGMLGPEREPTIEEQAKLDEVATRLLAWEEAKLLRADPIFVSAEMCHVVETAARTFRPEPLMPEDLMTPAGFLYYERPIEVLKGTPEDGVLTDYVGFSWAPLNFAAAPIDPAESVFLTTYFRWNVPLGLPEYEQGTDEKLARLNHELQRDVLEPWFFRREPARRRQQYWWQLVQSTLRLMQEWKPASRYDMRPDRPARRAAKRAGFHDREIIVVRLRRKRSLSERLGGVANYSHRFLVSGHWRNQWFPSTNTHRQVWISPYVKGPDDKPLKTPAGRVFVLHE